MHPSELDTMQRDPDSGRKFGRYEILATLGAGGMGVVYRARDERLGRDVAIKIVRPGLLASDSARARFRREALALARLNHPNIATIHDAGVHDGSDYLVMEFVQGHTLREILQNGALSPLETLTLAREIASALEEAHAQGVVHRDLKPGNIMVTAKGHAKVLDFGLAKLLAQENDATVTQEAVDTADAVGTPLYMSPEQAEGRAIDARTDLWSLGVVVYESLSGRTPFGGDSGLAILRAVTRDDPAPLRGVPQEAEKVVERALEKDVAARYQSAEEMSHDIDVAIARLTAPVERVPRKAASIPMTIAAIALVAIAATGAWLVHRSEQKRRAKEEALPESVRLFSADLPLGAYQILEQAARVLPNDPQIAELLNHNTQTISIDSSPRGAAVDVQDYLAPDKPWTRLGVTPLKGVRFPRGLFRWKIGDTTLARWSGTTMTFDLAAQQRAPANMAHIEAASWRNMIAFIGWVGPYDLPAFDIDRFEVTNRDYQKFVDDGGYRKPQYWREPFVLNGRPLQWDEAMRLLRDRSGRPGPSTWVGGHYPDGQAGFPVSGVSWYEASAYAAYAGKTLPILSEWFSAAPARYAPFAVRESNISRASLAPAGAFAGVGPYGTYDMIGNVREWVANATTAGEHFILGGAWNAQSYLAVNPEALPPFDRSPENGFRCVRNDGPVPAEAAGPVKTLDRDFTAFKPASDDVFRVYRSMYAYDPAPLDARVERVVQDTLDWREEKVSFTAAYDGERIIAYLFVPKRVRPPFQTVVFFPSARVLDLKDSGELGDVKFFDYVVQSGRAVLYPVYKGTYERQDTREWPGTHGDAELMIRRAKDVGRALDYLETRADIDKDRLAYLGVSMGAAEGVIFATLQQNALKTVVFLDGGFFLSEQQPGTDQADFAPRLKTPVLMVNGRYDFTFPLVQSQEPLFRMLGAKAEDKQHVVLDTPHDVTARRPELARAVLGWFDRYLGPIQ